MKRLFLGVIGVCALVSCAAPHVEEKSDEQRIDEGLSRVGSDAPPEGLAFQANSPPADTSGFFFGDDFRGYWVGRHPYYGGGYYGGYGYGPGGYGFRHTPPMRSRALTNPQGMPGGSRPGLLP